MKSRLGGLICSSYRCVSLCVLHNADFSGAQGTAVELKALLLNVEDRVVLLIWLRGHESRFVLVGVKFLADGVDAGEAVLGKGLHENRLRHLETLVEVGQLLEVVVLLGDVKLFLRDSAEGAVEVIDGLDEILCEGLDGEFASRLDLALGAVLEIAEVGDGTKALVL